MRRNSFVVTLCSLIALATVSIYEYDIKLIIPVVLVLIVSFGIGMKVNEKFLILSQRLLVGLVLSVIVYLSLVSNSISTTILFVPVLTFVFFTESKFELRLFYLIVSFVALFFSFLRFWPEVGVTGVSFSNLAIESLSDCLLATIFTGIFIRSHSVFSRLTIEVAKTQALRLKDSISTIKLTIAELEDQREHLSSVRERTSRALEGERTAAREVRASKEQLEQFAYAASHDLKEPIRTVRSFFQVIRRRAKPEVLAQAEIAKYVSIVEEKSSSMHGMLERLLLFSRLSSHKGVNQKQSLRRLIETGLHMQQASPELSVHVESGAEEIYLDTSCAKRIFTELLANSIMFASEERPLLLDFRAKRMKEGYVTCALSDNGIGISEEDLSRVTGLFQRLKQRNGRSTSGLGLSIAKAVVNREGGEFWLESELGNGTTVYFELPAEGSA